MCLIELLVFGIAFVIAFLDLLAREDSATATAERAAGGAPRADRDPGRPGGSTAPKPLPPREVPS
jgi:hypothetical protein